MPVAPQPLDPAAFRRALGHFPSGITVVTVRDRAGTDQGMTVSAFCSASLTPPLVLVCIGHDATIAGAVAGAEGFGVSVLAERQVALSRKFAGAETNRFEGVAVTRGLLGVALLDGAAAQLECRIIARHEAGDHTIVVGEVVHAREKDGDPLVYHRGKYRQFEP